MNTFLGSLAHRWFLLSACLIALAPATGCSLLATGLWIINPNDIDAQYDGLQKRRVAVVCQPNSALALQNHGVNQELAARVSNQLREQVDDIKIVSQAEINDWIDQNELTSFAEFGKAMNADAVVAIELPEFRLYQGSSMLQGAATAEVTVYDVATDEVEHTLDPVNSLYPPENGIPIDLANQKSAERQFRRRFIGVLADQISRNFHAYDSRAAVKTDRFY